MPAGPQGKAWVRAILHLDMDAFYVNVHIQEHPEDKGIPLIVGGRPDQRGVVASASYEARRMGIHSAMPTSQALRIFPRLKIVSANWKLIRARSRQVMAVLEKHGPLEQVSVDEAYVDLSANADPVSDAAAIKYDVNETVSLPCSVGLAPNKLVAKVASDHDKPDGFTIVQPGNEAAFLSPKPTRALWGIGPRTAERLAAVQIHTCGQLAGTDPQIINKVLGRHGIEFIERAKGIDSRKVNVAKREAKSISQEWTFNTDVNDADLLQEQLAKMCASVSKSLRKRELVAHTVTVKIRWADFTTFTRQKSYDVGLESEAEIFRLAKAIFRENWSPEHFIRLLGVGVSNLEAPQVRQLRLPFDSD
jgi:DNA polymerase IV